jgi:hypothetical protein
MSTASEEARAKAKDKVERLTRADPRERVDASGYSPEGFMHGDIQTGPRPISRRQFKRGGKVAGEASPARADRKPRATGGALTANSLINRNVKDANEDREGIKHIGGMKKGGRARRAKGGKTDWISKNSPLKPHEMAALHAENKYNVSKGLAPYPTVQSNQRPPQGISKFSDGGRAAHAEGGKVHGKGCDCGKCDGGRVGRAKGGPAINDGTRPVAGRLARKGGGRTKKGTNVNIIIAPQGGGQPGAGGPPPVPPGGPVGMHQGAPPPAAMGPGVPPGAMPPGAPPPMRKAGGRVGEGFEGKFAKPGKYPIDSGAGGGLGRLEKAREARR